ncbi:MAG: hypothetical protein ABI950_11760 [Solirubrobacteraceae bacterium]
MPQNEARSWWADVADVRESIERRRAGDASETSSSNAGDELAHVRARRAMAARERTGRFDREPRRSGRFDRAPGPRSAPAPAPAPAHVESVTTSPADAPRRPLVDPLQRRTVQITGHPGARAGISGLIEIDRRRAARRPVERIGPRPDRLAMWAVLLGLFLILVAATSSHAALLGA